MDEIDRERLGQYRICISWDERNKRYAAIVPEWTGVGGFGATRVQAMDDCSANMLSLADYYTRRGWPLPTPHLLERTR